MLDSLCSASFLNYYTVEDPCLGNDIFYHHAESYNTNQQSAQSHKGWPNIILQLRLLSQMILGCVKVTVTTHQDATLQSEF